MNTLRVTIAIFAAIGAIAFGFAFAASLVAPGFVEQIAKRIIRYEVESKVREKLDSLDANSLVRRAERFVGAYSEEIAFAKRQLAEGLPAKIAGVVAEMQNLDCECRLKIERNISGAFEWRIRSAFQAQERLTTLIRTKYMEIAEKLIREFRIFAGTNAVVFALLFVAALVKKKAGIHLLPPAMVLLCAAVLTAYLYLFNQDWLHTIIFSDYVGMTYVAHLAVVFFFICDLLFNRARITAEIMNQLLGAIGSAVYVAPC